MKQGLRTSNFLNEKTDLNYPKLTEDQRHWLKDLYKEDIAILKKITHRDFNEWIDFN